jgi:Pro-kumamolisin, activation domain/Bacterial Ig-like domain (group 3)
MSELCLRMGAAPIVPNNLRKGFDEKMKNYEGVMNSSGLVRRLILGAFGLALAGAMSVQAQRAPVASRLVDTVNDADSVRIQGNVHPYARPAYDRGALADSQPMSRMLLLLQRGADQEQSLRQLLDEQQTKGSGSYHSWLTPEQFGKQFGPADSDVQAVTDWLAKQGFEIGKISAGRIAIEFSGNVAQVRNAFHTEIHRFVANGEEHFANVSDPAIPRALSPVVAGLVALHNFPRQAHFRTRGVYRRNTSTGQLTPLFTYGNPVNFAVGPGDFKTIYSIPNGADGTGQSIAIVGQSNINVQDVRDFRSMFGLPAKDPQIVLNGPDPGLVSQDESESDLDVEWAGAVAPNANIILVASQSATTDPFTVIGGVDLSALYVIDNNLAPVLSESYRVCESLLGTTGNAFYNAMWQQAAAEGITVVVSSGDSGSAGCDPDPSGRSPNAAIDGVAVSGIASTPYNVAAGGTDFDPSTTGTTSTYWSLTSGTVNSAVKYMPETTWSDSPCAFNFPTACTAVDSAGADLTGGGGGPSNCAISSSSSCTSGYPKPAYQTGITPNTTGYTTRLIPDISLFSSNGQNGVALVVCQSDANPGGVGCNLNTPFQDFSLVGGTSAATPAFAAIMALVNQQTGQRQGNANYALYGLAKLDTNYASGKCASSVGQTPASGCAFNDVTKGNNSVACVAGTPNCNNTTATGFGVLIYGGSAAAFTAGNGYDLATGLGSVNVTNLLAKWNTFSRTATTTTLGTPNPQTGTSGQSFSIAITVTPSAATGDASLTALASDQTTILGSFGPFTLSGGKVTASTKLLPAGTAFVKADYGGDVTYGASTSSTVAVNVSGANQTSKTTVGFVTLDVNNNPILPPTTGSVTATYGSPYILQIAVTNSGGTACTSNGTITAPGSPCPTGSVALTDNGSALNDWPIVGQVNATNVARLLAQGIAEDQAVQLAAGSHSIVAAFTTGDGNFQSSTSSPLPVTINQAGTATSVMSSSSSITSGQTVTLTATVSSSSNGEATCGIANGGTVQFTLDGAPISGTVSYTPISGATSTTGAGCVATLSTAISGLYPMPKARPQSPLAPLIPMVLALLSMLFFASGLKWVPRARRRTYVYAGFVALVLTAVAVAGCGGGGGGTGGGKNRSIGASYSGDTNYSKSAATPFGITVM